MKDFKKIVITSAAAFALNCSILFAAPAFSGIASGSIGVDGKIPLNKTKSTWNMPVALFGAMQIDFNEWFTMHAEIEMRAKDFPIKEVFVGSDGIFRVHELSAVFSSRSTTATNFFSLYLGSYEAIGTDTFLLRQFGMDPISSPLTKSVTNIAGVPLYQSSGGGLSYIARLDKTPLSTGFYLYANRYDSGKIALNLDYRLALAVDKFTMDFVAGIGAPIRDKDEYSDNYVIAIKTLNLHGGISMLLGNKYTHGLLLQAGIKELTLKGKNSFKLEGDDFSFLFEPRIRFKYWGLNVTGYSLSQECVDDLLYLTDKFGGGLTVYFDHIESKHGQMIAGVHAIASIANKTLLDFLNGESTSNLNLNVFVTPYIEVPFSQTSKLEAMVQVGALDILRNPCINFKGVVGFRKQF